MLNCFREAKDRMSKFWFIWPLSLRLEIRRICSDTNPASLCILWAVIISCYCQDTCKVITLTLMGHWHFCCEGKFNNIRNKITYIHLASVSMHPNRFAITRINGVNVYVCLRHVGYESSRGLGTNWSKVGKNRLVTMSQMVFKQVIQHISSENTKQLKLQRSLRLLVGINSKKPVFVFLYPLCGNPN